MKQKSPRDYIVEFNDKVRSIAKETISTMKFSVKYQNPTT